MGFSIADQINQLPIDMQGNVLGVGSGGMPSPDGLTPQVGTPAFQEPVTFEGPGQVSMPGMGGKGGATVGVGSGGMPPGDASVGMGGKGPLSQIPIDMQGNVLGAGQPAMPAQANMPSPPPMMTPQTGTPGRPVPTEPFTPRGPGYANPGSAGVIPAQKGAVPSQGPQIGIGSGGLPPGVRKGIPPGANVADIMRQAPTPMMKPPAKGPMKGPARLSQRQMAGAGRGGILR